MRGSVVLVSLLMLAGAAHAEPLLVKKGMWSVSSDVYTEAWANGQRSDIPSNNSGYEQCWSTDEEVTIDDNIISGFGDCSVLESWFKTYSYDADISCDFDGISMSGVAEFMVNKEGDSFTGRFSLQGHQNGLDISSETILMGHRTGACTAPN